MSDFQHHSGRSSYGSDRIGANSTFRGDPHANSTRRADASAPTTQNPRYDPDRDSTYTPVYRPWSHHPQANGATNGEASHTAPQAQQPSAYSAPHHFETSHSSSHLRISSYHPSESDFPSSPPPHTASSADRRALPGQYQPLSGGYQSVSTAPQRSEPYHAVGYIRRDREVYDKDEVYEEYRPYDPYAHQRGQQQHNGSN